MFSGMAPKESVDKLEDILDQLTKLEGDFLIGEDLKKGVESVGTRIFRFSYSTEMLPDPENYVTLHETDKDPVSGMPLPKINFKIDRNNPYNQNAFQFASTVLQNMLATIGAKDAQTISSIAEFSGAGHIMGTTKMGMSAKSAVVDSNCCSFDHPNLFIVGPGVFTTSGTANPTLTAAALSLRLACHLKKQLQSKSIHQA
jgi:glucose dehydrogenase